MGNSQPSQNAIKTLSLITNNNKTNNNHTPTSPTSDKHHHHHHWIPDTLRDSCSQCNTAFTFTNRRHHCRLCGEIFCAAHCESVTVSLPLRETVTIRCCGPCKYVQIDALNNVRKADAFQMARVLESFLNDIAYVPHNLNSHSTPPALFPSVIDNSWIQIFKEKGGKCQENLIYLEDLIDEASHKHHHQLSDRGKAIFDNFHKNVSTFQLFDSKQSKLETDESCVLLFRCVHYFVLSRSAASFLQGQQSVEASNLLGSIQFHRTPEAFRWFCINMAYIFGSGCPSLLPTPEEISESKTSSNKPVKDWDLRRRRANFCGFILRNTYIEASHYILKTLTQAKDFREDDGQKEVESSRVRANSAGISGCTEARDTLSWMLLGLYFLASLNECNQEAFRGDPNDHAVGFGFIYDHRDGPHKGNLVTNLKKIVNERLERGVNELSADEKKWYDYVMNF